MPRFPKHLCREPQPPAMRFWLIALRVELGYVLVTLEPRGLHQHIPCGPGGSNGVDVG